MRISIIPIDGTVVVNSLGVTRLTWEGTPEGVHALQWYGTWGEIEYVDSAIANERIESLPDWANNAVSSWEIGSQLKEMEITAQLNKDMARQLLSDTDWTTNPDISNPAISNPYLSNPEDFIPYRNALRAIAINPVDGEMEFPVKPSSNWVFVE